MKNVNIIMTWLCLIIGVFFVGLFIYSWTALKQIDPVMLLYVVGAIVTAKVFWKRHRAATRQKVGEPN